MNGTGFANFARGLQAHVNRIFEESVIKPVDAVIRAKRTFRINMALYCPTCKGPTDHVDISIESGTFCHMCGCNLSRSAMLSFTPIPPDVEGVD